MKLLQRFILYTSIIIAISVFIGFIIANFIYVALVKEQMNTRYLEIAEQLAVQIEEHEITAQASADFLRTMSRTGYQIVLVNRDGEIRSFGEEFQNDELNEDMRALFDGETSYNGVRSFKNSYMMMSHFTNDIENTVGTTLQIEGEEQALFLRSNNTSFFTEFHLVIFGFVLAVFISSLLGILLLSRKLTHSLSELTSATQEIAKHNFDYPLTIDRTDEIGQLADSFRLMQQRLANTDQARKNFINNVSHDFQSPLLNIQGYSELLNAEINSSEGRKYNGIIQSEAQRLSNLTKQLLVLTSIDQGTYPVHKQKVRIDEQLDRIVYSMLWRIEDKELEITLDLHPATVYADPSLLANAWENLLVNAVKYNKQFGEISITCREEQSGVIVKIADTGIGIAEDHREKIFDRFYRVGQDRDKKGMGLGLSIVQEVLSYHEAAIEVESELGKGTNITIMFPKKA